MKSLNRNTLFLALIISIITLPISLFAQNCGCAPDQCCSNYGYCGTTEEYCGPGNCKSGPCQDTLTTPTTPTTGGDCGCAPDQCCSNYGYCGTTEEYCGPGNCKSGPCQDTPTTSTTPTTGGNCECAPDQCCSNYGYCGTTEEYCGPGNCKSGPCQSTPTTPTTPTTGGDCGCAPDQCCSNYGYCGTTEEYCGLGNCKSGPCQGTPTTPTTPTTGGYCECAPDQCCNNYGYCGTTEEYCGPSNCKSGPCRGTPTTPTTLTNGGSGPSVSDLVSQAFFDGIIGQADATCAGKNFYTRDAFLGAISNYPQFGTSGSSDDNKREIAAFFAHVSHETTNFCHIEENDGAATNDVYCDPTKAGEYPCAAGKKYYGRGPLQLSWNYNYGDAGHTFGFDGLGNPEKVATDVGTSFNTAIWYWMTYLHPIMNQGFGATINVINGDYECKGKNQDKANDRMQFYNKYCAVFGVDPGTNLSC